jgi:hypothetical protein
MSKIYPDTLALHAAIRARAELRIALEHVTDDVARSALSATLACLGDDIAALGRLVSKARDARSHERNRRKYARRKARVGDPSIARAVARLDVAARSVLATWRRAA